MTFFSEKYIKYNSDEVFISWNGYFFVEIIVALEHLNTDFNVNLVMDLHFRNQKYEIELWSGIHNYFNALFMFSDNYWQNETMKICKDILAKVVKMKNL